MRQCALAIAFSARPAIVSIPGSEESPVALDAARHVPAELETDQPDTMPNAPSYPGRALASRDRDERSRAARGLVSDPDRPRERLHALGPSALSDAELLALVLRTGGGGRDALDSSRLLLARCEGLAGLARAAERDLAEIPGIGPAKIASLRATLEIGRRIARRRVRTGDVIRSPEDVQAHFHAHLRDAKHEFFVVLLLDGRHRVLREVIVSQGTLTASLVHPREVFRVAVREAAAALVLVHNHPSGDPSPSPEDHRVTERLVAAGAIVGIRVLDHVVVAEKGYHSFSEAGDLPAPPEGSGRLAGTREGPL